MEHHLHWIRDKNRFFFVSKSKKSTNQTKKLDTSWASTEFISAHCISSKAMNIFVEHIEYTSYVWWQISMSTMNRLYYQLALIFFCLVWFETCVAKFTDVKHITTTSTQRFFLFNFIANKLRCLQSIKLK